MEYEQLKKWGARIIERGKAAGEDADAIREDVYNAALTMLSDENDVITESAINTARRLVAETLPGPVKGALITVYDPGRL